MEWVETTAKTVEEAQDLALDKLGVDELEAEFEVLEEPRPGLFGRMRGQARVRARIQPKAPRPKEDRGRRRRSGGAGKKRSDAKKSEPKKASTKQASDGQSSSTKKDDSGRDADASTGSSPATAKERSGDKRPAKKSGAKSRNRKPEQPTEESSMEEVSSCVEEFLSGLTSAFGLDAPVVIDTTGGEINAQIEGKHGLLLGPKARTLDAIQELTRVAAQRTAPSSIRIKVDVGGYRAQRKASLETFAVSAAERAVAEGTEIVLEPMSSADRKAVHDRLSEFDGVSTRSAGNDPRRYVIIVPDGDSTAEEPATEEPTTDEAADAADSEGDAS